MISSNNEKVQAFGKQVASKLCIPAQLATILFQRGMRSLEEVTEFLYPQLSSLPSPYLMRDMHKAVDCLIEACRNNKTILIHGDYDVDGISATALMISFFREVGMQATHYIPNRLHERYGLSNSSIDRLLAKVDRSDRGVLLTVDCGISSVDEVAYAKKHGLKVIISDHHEPPTLLPAADATLNPKLKDCLFPYPALAGVGVAFFLAMALRRALVENSLLTKNKAPNLKKYLDLVALGTVGDVVPLTKINRILVKAGLEVLSAKRRPGVFSLCEQCGLQDAPILAEDISFKLAPRINASGRLGDPDCALDLLLAPDIGTARNGAEKLEKMNNDRRAMETLFLPAIIKECEKQVALGRKALVVHAPTCHPGILGILAARIVNQFGKPAVIFTDDREKNELILLKGSGRSVPNINLYSMLDRCVEWIHQFGGHAMAVGLTVQVADFAMFAEKMNSEIETIDVSEGNSTVPVEYSFKDKKELTLDLINSLQLMQPFGEGNPEPVFLLPQQRLHNLRASKGHLLFSVQLSEKSIRGVGFGMGGSITLAQDKPVDVACKLKKTWFKGEESHQVQGICITSS